MTEFVQYLVGGLATGSVYGLIALGFVLVFKSTDVFNFAQGDLLMLGAYITVTALVTFHLPLGPAMIFALLASAVVGLLIQQLIIRHMLGQPLLTVVMVTIALSLVIRGLVVILYGPEDRALESRLPNDTLTILGVKVSQLDLTIMGVAAVCVALFAVFFQRTAIGLQMRATAENPEAAALSGVNSGRVFSLAFALGTVLAAIGGILLANRQLLSPTLGEVGLLAFPAAVIGGLTSIPGAVVGGLVIGVIEKLATGYVDASAATVFVYGALLLMLLVRPYGLFGEHEIRRV
jgi:branched-chain amino acid transport system permease protein